MTVVPGTGSIVDARAHHVRVSDGSEVVGDALILATGSVPRSLPGLDFDGSRVLSSDHVLDLTEVPARVAIVGAGAIGCEFASLLSDLGASVTLLEALPRVLPGVDAACSEVVEPRAFRKRGIAVHAGARVTSIEGTRELAVTFDDAAGTQQQVTVDRIVISIGRAPRVDGIGIEGSGIELDEHGAIRVDEQQRTTVPGVYAVGDVAGGPQLAHVGFAEAIVAIKTVLGEPTPPVDDAKVPWGIYCHPEVASAGLTEEAALEHGFDVVTSVHRFAGNSRAVIMGETDGLVKIVAEHDGVILGVHIVGPWATELLGEGYLAVNWEATVADVGNLIHPHPTLGELFGESALALTGRALHG